MNDHIALLHAEVQQSLRIIRITHEDRRQLSFGAEAQPGVNPVIRGGDRLDFRGSAKPVVHVLRPGGARSREIELSLLGRLARRIHGGRIGIEKANGVHHRVNARIGLARGGGVLKSIRAAIRVDHEIRADVGRLGLQDHVIVVKAKGDGLQIAPAVSGKRFSVLEDQFNRIPDIAV